MILAAATPVLADGGSGGGGGGTGPGGPGGTGGTDNATSTGGNGNPGSNSGGGGGGGAGTTGGSGNRGGDDSCCSGGGGAGGNGGGSAGAEGHHGNEGKTGGGGGGGGGGAHGFVGNALPTNNDDVRGGRGGQGGQGSNDPSHEGGGGGGGGAGGYGIVITGSGQLGTIHTHVNGGSGGNGGAGGNQTSLQFTHAGFGGYGGTGGVGLQLNATSQVKIHSRSIIAGGDGGDAGVGSIGSNATGGNGGIGIVSASGSTITNDAIVKGGIGGAGGLGIVSFKTGVGGTGGNGGDGVSLSGNSSLVNNRTVTGGNGGFGGETPSDVGGVGGTGGNGVSLNGGTVTNNGTIQGGQGGQGGHGRVQTTSGNGGVGGSGASVAAGTLINNSTITGGRGGEGGSGGTRGGNGSVGGTGVSVTGGTLINTGTITGGRGGRAGTGVDHDGSSGAAASGMSIAGGTVINSGTIAAGSSQVDAVTFGAGVNLLELRAGSNIQGTVNAKSSDNDALALGGSGSATFDVGKIGHQYLGFEGFDKTGSGTWTLEGKTDAVTPWTISQGTLSVSRDDSLGAVFGGLNFDGGTGENATLRNTAAFTTGRNIVVSSGTATFDTAADLTVTGVISGSGAGGLVKTGNGTLTLTGANTYLGDTTISAGTLSVSADANLGASISSLSFNGGTLENTSAFTTARSVVLGATGGTLNTTADLTVTGAISGPGALTKTGAGTLTLGGDITFAGNTIIAAGTLAFDRSNDAVYGGAISGTGALAKLGTGTLTLPGASTYTGSTMVNAGALNVIGSLGATAVTVANGATLIGTGSIGGAVTVQNGGNLNGVSGSTLSMGSLTLDASSTVFALINSPGGALFKVGNDLTLAGTLNVETTGGYGPGVYHLFKYDGSLTGTGLTIGSQPAGFMTSVNTATAQQVNLTVYADPTKTQFWQGGSNPVGGSGTWSAANTNWLNADSSASTFWGGVQGIFHGTAGAVTVESPQTFQSLEFVVDGYSLVAGSGGELVPTGMAQLWAEGAGTTATIAAPITGAGGIVKIGAGTIVLTGANTYSGGTAIDAGTLSVSSDANLGAASGGLTFNGGTLKNTSAFTTERTISLATGGGTFNTAADLTAAGIISGSGALVKTGAGRLTLTGTNTYTGGTTIDAGVLRIGSGGASGSIIGSIANNGVLAFDRSDDVSYTGAVSGAGALAKYGAGALTLTGTNTYTGGTTIDAGTLRIGNGGTSGSIIGDVANNGILAFDRSDNLSHGGTVSGTGVLAKYGAGTLMLTGTNTYTGGTTINAGTLSISSDTNLGNARGGLIFNGGTLENTSLLTTARAITLITGGGTFSTAANLTATSVISGAGALTKTGAGTLTLTGSNTYTGGTIVDTGMLRIGNGGTTGSLVGDVVNNGVLAFDRFNHLSYTGAVSGIGALAKHGAGTLTLTGNNTYTGNTTVDRGALMVNGSIATSNLLTVNAGGLVGGTGTLPSTIVNGGTLSPGHSIGTINVQGNLTFSNTTNYLVDVSRTAADRINVSGTATLGGTVWLVATPDDYGRNTTYTILHAGGGVSGTETLSASVSSVFLDPTLSYDANNVFLNLTQLPFSAAAQTPNQRAVADALQAGGIHSALGAAVFNQATTAAARHAFDALSGEVHASVAGVLLDDSRYLRGAVLGRLRQAPYTQGPLAAFGIGGPTLAYQRPQPPVYATDFPFKGAPAASPLRSELTFWSQGYGAWGTFDGNRNVATFDRSLGGTLIGLDSSLADGWRTGFAAGYSQSNVTIGARASSATIESGNVALYGGGRFGALSLRGGGAYAYHQIDTSRSIAFPGLAERATSRYDGATAQMFGELGYGFGLGVVAVEPFAGLAWLHVKTNGFAETGGNAALAGAEATQDVGYTTLGARFATTFGLMNGITLTPRATLAWQHAFNDVTPNAALTFQSTGVGFGITGVPQARDSALIEAGLDLVITPQATLGVSYLGQIASSVHDHAVRGQFTWRF